MLDVMALHLQPNPYRRINKTGGNIMWWDFLLFITIGPLIGLCMYFLSGNKKRSEEHLNQLRENSHLVC